jgi:hypothetical protein
MQRTIQILLFLSIIIQACGDTNQKVATSSSDTIANTAKDTLLKVLLTETSKST